jgi:hypothetical protein
MMRDNRLWLLFAGLAIALSVACSSTPAGPSDEDAAPASSGSSGSVSAGPGTQDAMEIVADSMTQG